MTTSGNSSYPQKIKYTLKQTKIPKTYQEIVKIFSLFKYKFLNSTIYENSSLYKPNGLVFPIE